MSTDLHDRLTAAAPTDAGEFDFNAIWARGQRQRRALRIGGALAVVCVLALGGFAVAALQRSDSPTVTTPSPKGTIYADSARGYQVTIPPGWTRATQVLTPYVVDPAEQLSAATLPISDTGAGPACNAQLPKGVIDQLGTHDIYVLVAQIAKSGQLPTPLAPVNPSAYPPRPDTFANAQWQDVVCAGPNWSYPNDTFQRATFTDGGRVFVVHVAQGNAVTDAQRAELWALLDSFKTS